MSEPVTATPQPSLEYIAHPRPLRRMNWRFVALLLALFVISLMLNSYRNGFPYFYHPDEPNKVRQILEDTRNFNHPLLMLELADGASRVLPIAKQPQDIVELGRWLSAIYLAVATVCAAWLIWQWWGALAAVLGGLLFALAPDVVELSHYFKEDPALVMCLGLFFVAALLWEARGGWKRLILLGLTAGLCASAKYIGFMVLPLGLALLLWRGIGLSQGAGSRHWLHLAAQLSVYLVAGALAFGIINARMFTDAATARKSLDRETELATKGQAGMRKDIPHSGFVERFGQRTGVLIPFYIAGWCLLVKLSRQRKRFRTEWLYLAFPLLLTLVLSFSAKDSGRYFLPAILGITGTAAAGLAGFIGLCIRKNTVSWRLLAGVLLAPVLYVTLQRAYIYEDGFRRDGRTELLSYMEHNLAQNAVILQGNKVFLPAPDHRYTDAWRVQAPREIRTCKIVADEAATPAELRAQGITHVVMNVAEYGRYLNEDQRPSKEIQADYERRRAFYQDLLQNGKLIWESADGKIGTNNPDLRLYELPGATPR